MHSNCIRFVAISLLAHYASVPILRSNCFVSNSNNNRSWRCGVGLKDPSSLERLYSRPSLFDGNFNQSKSLEVDTETVAFSKGAVREYERTAINPIC